MALAIVAIVLKGLLPVGWMPNPQGFSESALILCDMDGPMSAADMAKMMAAMPGMDMSSTEKSGAHDKKAPDSSRSHEECPFAGVTHGGAASTPAAIALPELAVEHAHRPLAERSIARFARYQPQSPRAPPELA
ncbi:MAG TPA: DUF2946 family protein [Rhizomicrobium sp.]|nr:DUF2946 family protein [Rhizomicrobium sp.]